MIDWNNDGKHDIDDTVIDLAVLEDMDEEEDQPEWHSEKNERRKKSGCGCLTAVVFAIGSGLIFAIVFAII